MGRLTRDGTAEPVPRDQILRHERGQGDNDFPCSADHEQDYWQPYPIDPCSDICVTIHHTKHTNVILYAIHQIHQKNIHTHTHMSGALENAGKRGPWGKEKEWTDCVAKDRRRFRITGD